MMPVHCHFKPSASELAAPARRWQRLVEIQRWFQKKKVMQPCMRVLGWEMIRKLRRTSCQQTEGSDVKPAASDTESTTHPAEMMWGATPTRRQLDENPKKGVRKTHRVQSMVPENHILVRKCTTKPNFAVGCTEIPNIKYLVDVPQALSGFVQDWVVFRPALLSRSLAFSLSLSLSFFLFLWTWCLCTLATLFAKQQSSSPHKSNEGTGSSTRVAAAITQPQSSLTFSISAHVTL